MKDFIRPMGVLDLDYTDNVLYFPKSSTKPTRMANDEELLTLELFKKAAKQYEDIYASNNQKTA